MEKVSVNLIQTKHPVYFIDEKDIREIVKKSNPEKRIGDINIPELEKKLNQLPAVDSANVYLNLNGNLHLDIKQRVPAFRLNKNGNDFYVDGKGTEFPISKNYSFPCMLVTGDVDKSEYIKLAELVDKIDRDEFSKKYFIGISKEKENYNLLTSQGNYKVEIGNLENINLKVKGFKTFVEKHLVYQEPEKYTKISVKYDNQIVTTLNPYFKENDSMMKVGSKELAKAPSAANSIKKESLQPAAKKPETKPKEKPKVSVSKPKTEVKTTAKKETSKPKTATSKSAAKPKTKVKIE
ncbi:cell division protein FtsQ [Kaistella sp. BT6-1-3]|uniref:Cell division protein FtsQ n=1 Tax=Kaistella yananensis TaxID=2989820 RepID=A0ABT3JLX7_9FLAO|nr:cell division protein FtsQ [Kaistella yananensis]MCW4451721.1 cell division protein FtsQ [Kaistella yananensis]